jgi:hypothetical protein
MTKVYHATVLNAQQTLEAPVLHVGTLGQAQCVLSDFVKKRGKSHIFKGFFRYLDNLDQIKEISIFYNEAQLFEYTLDNNILIHKRVLNDTEANAVHALHAKRHNYPISGSVYYSSTFPECDHDIVHESLDALDSGYTLMYENVSEGGGTSYLVPAPHLVFSGHTQPSVLSAAVYNRQPSSLERALGGILDAR